MTLVVPTAFCPHPDHHLTLAVDNRAEQTQAIVRCDLCSSSWTPDLLSGELLDRCLRLFEAAQ